MGCFLEMGWLTNHFPTRDASDFYRTSGELPSPLISERIPQAEITKTLEYRTQYSALEDTVDPLKGVLVIVHLSVILLSSPPLSLPLALPRPSLSHPNEPANPSSWPLHISLLSPCPIRTFGAHLEGREVGVHRQLMKGSCHACAGSCRSWEDRSSTALPLTCDRLAVSWDDVELILLLD